MYNKEYEGDVCTHKHAFFLDNYIRRLFQNPEKIVGDYLKEGYSAIDIGCGPGFFTIDMAKMVGKKGKVIAVDLQPEMLAKVEKKAKKLNLLKRITLHRCPQDKIGLPQDVKVDLILAYYMVHETPNPKNFLKEIKSYVNDQGKVLIVEPKFHVSEKLFKETEQDALDAGFRVLDRPVQKGGRCLLLSH